MSEKRFKSVIDEDTMSVMPYLVSDKEEECFYNLQGCVDLLNKMSDEIEEVEISIKLFEDDVQIKDKKIGEQQATISQLKEENEQLKKYCTVLKNQIKKMGEIGGFNKHLIKTILESNYDD